MASGYNLPRLPELDGFFGPSQIGQPVMDRQSPLKRKAEEVVSATLESARKVAKTFETPESSNTVSPEFTPPKTPTPRAADPGEEELRALARELVEHLDNHLMARLPFPPPAPYRLVEGPDGRHLQYVTPPWAPDPDEADKARREAADKEAAKRARALEKADAKRTVVEGGAGEKPASPSSPSIRGGSSSTRTRNESPPTVASSPPVQVGMTLRSCSRRASAVPVGGAAHESGPSKRSLAAQRRWKRDRENATSSGLPLKQWGRK
ncbi:MAG: hypothetical protein M4579_000189 [Chaenotheca gracillima]|nr:MAG: hypothetical protein M4579_000189 [Chaenotheca gracillima]